MTKPYVIAFEIEADSMEDAEKKFGEVAEWTGLTPAFYDDAGQLAMQLFRGDPQGVIDELIANPELQALLQSLQQEDTQNIPIKLDD